MKSFLAVVVAFALILAGCGGSPAASPAPSTVSETAEGGARGEPSPTAEPEPTVGAQQPTASPSLPTVNFESARAEQEHADKLLDHFWTTFENVDPELTDTIVLYSGKGGDLPPPTDEQKRAIAEQATVFADEFADRYNELVNAGYEGEERKRLLQENLDRGLLYGDNNWATELARLAAMFDPCLASPVVYVYEDNAVARERAVGVFRNLLEIVVVELQHGAGSLIGGSEGERLGAALRAAYIVRKIILDGIPVSSEGEAQGFSRIAATDQTCVDDPKIEPTDWRYAKVATPTPVPTAVPTRVLTVLVYQDAQLLSQPFGPQYLFNESEEQAGYKETEILDVIPAGTRVQVVFPPIQKYPQWDSSEYYEVLYEGKKGYIDAGTTTEDL